MKGIMAFYRERGDLLFTILILFAALGVSNAIVPLKRSRTRCEVRAYGPGANGKSDAKVTITRARKRLLIDDNHFSTRHHSSWLARDEQWAAERDRGVAGDQQSARAPHAFAFSL